MISIIVAKTLNNVIGKNNGMPWSLPNDLKYFKDTTVGSFVVMGRRTFESLGRPLPNRMNILVSRDAEWCKEQLGKFPELIFSSNLTVLLETVKHTMKDTNVFVIGGGQIFEQALPYTDSLLITEIQAEVEGDTYFPNFNINDYEEVGRRKQFADEKNQYDHDFVLYYSKNFFNSLAKENDRRI